MQPKKLSASPVRILLDYRPALRQRTGVGEYAHELTLALAATPPGDAGDADRLTVFSSSWKDRLLASAVPGARIVDRRIPNQVLNFAWHRLGWPPVEWLARGPFDVVHAFHPLLIPARAAAQVVTIADLDFLDHPERTVREIRRDYAALAASHAQRADHVVVISESTARDTHERLGVPRERITVCTPGAPAWARREREPAAGCLLFLGTLELRKNLSVLLDAYSRLIAARPDAPPLVLAGKHTESAQALIARAMAPPLAGRVELPGYVGDQAREALYRRALVFVMPSHTEGFGMPVLEAMTVGVPVVVTRRGALLEVAPPGVGRAFDPDSAESLAALLDELLANQAARDELREAGWQQAKRFSWQASASNLREAWRAAAAHRSARG
jgi:glycosyltransferase involved in cell wall biosynthesis